MVSISFHTSINRKKPIYPQFVLEAMKQCLDVFSLPPNGFLACLGNDFGNAVAHELIMAEHVTAFFLIWHNFFFNVSRAPHGSFKSPAKQGTKYICTWLIFSTICISFQRIFFFANQVQLLLFLIFLYSILYHIKKSALTGGSNTLSI